jgi:hypothetical protein
MASARTTYQDRQGGGAEAAAHPFVWVSLSGLVCKFVRGQDRCSDQAVGSPR